MNRLETFKELLSSLEPYPNMRFMLFCDSWGELERELDSFILQNGHSLLVYTTLELNLPKKSHRKIKLFNPKQPKYNQQGRLYNYIFINHLPEDFATLAKKVYSSVANGGRVYLLREISDTISELQSSFEEANYLSVSKIELDSNMLYITGKKMHGWGA